MHRAELEDERETLKGIAATLLCLAVLAEFLSVVPFRVRILILSLLRTAETVAWTFAAERTGGALAMPAIIAHGADDGCAGALRLARCFRALASIFRRFQDLAGRLLFRGKPDGRFAQCAPALAWTSHLSKPRRQITIRAARCIDTS